MRVIRSASMGRSGTGRRAKRTGALAMLAALTTVSGVLIQSRSGASATAASRRPRAAVVAAQTNPSGSGARPLHLLLRSTRRWISSGDSLGYQAEPYLDMFFAETGNYTVSNNTYGGTATCDWLSRMAAAAAEHPQAAVLVFSGNAFTACMDGVALRSPRYYDLYTTDTEQAIGIVQRGRGPRLLGRDPGRSVLGGRVGPPRRHLPTAGPGRPPR